MPDESEIMKQAIIEVMLELSRVYPDGAVPMEALQEHALARYTLNLTLHELVELGYLEANEAFSLFRALKSPDDSLTERQRIVMDEAWRYTG